MQWEGHVWVWQSLRKGLLVLDYKLLFRSSIIIARLSAWTAAEAGRCVLRACAVAAQATTDATMTVVGTVKDLLTCTAVIPDYCFSGCCHHRLFQAGNCAPNHSHAGAGCQAHTRLGPIMPEALGGHPSCLLTGLLSLCPTPTKPMPATSWPRAVHMPTRTCSTSAARPARLSLS